MGNFRHGMYGTPTYKSWSEMKSRCEHPERSTGKYEDVSYCDRWKSFQNFYADMGERPAGTSLDRINPYGNYCPENCRWADIYTQENNRTNNVFYVVDGDRLTLPQIARKYNISRSNLANKIYLLNWSMEDAIMYLTKGVRTYRKKENV